MAETFVISMTVVVSDSDQEAQDVEVALRDLARDEFWEIASLLVVSGE